MHDGKNLLVIYVESTFNRVELSTLKCNWSPFLHEDSLYPNFGCITLNGEMQRKIKDYKKRIKMYY